MVTLVVSTQLGTSPPMRSVLNQHLQHGAMFDCQPMVNSATLTFTLKRLMSPVFTEVLKSKLSVDLVDALRTEFTILPLEGLSTAPNSISLQFANHRAPSLSDFTTIVSFTVLRLLTGFAMHLYTKHMKRHAPFTASESMKTR